MTRPDQVDVIDAWAAELAASLPPMTIAEAAAVGQLAAVIDARRDQSRPRATAG